MQNCKSTYTDLMQNGYTIIVGVTRHPPWVKRCIPRDAEIQRLFTRLIIFLI